MRCGLCDFLIIKQTVNNTAPCGVVWCTITCGAVRLCHFASGFGVVVAVCTVYAIW